MAQYARLVQDVAEFANSATTMRDALQRAVDTICETMKFPGGHGCALRGKRTYAHTTSILAAMAVLEVFPQVISASCRFAGSRPSTCARPRP